MTPVYLLLGAALGAAVLCTATATVVRRWARANDFVDRPGGHKGHAAPVALGGGIAVTLAVVVPMALGAAAARWIPPDRLPSGLAEHADGIVAKTPVALVIVTAVLAMCAMGVIDDVKPLRPRVKFLIQVAIVAFVVWAGELRLLSHLPSPLSAGLTILWLLLLSNSINFLDNMDGLACGVGLIAACVFGVTAVLSGQLFVPVCCFLLVGALAGLLPFNFSPASIYLGDAGSQAIGLLLGIFTVLTTFVSPEQSARPIGFIAPLVVMAVPLYDTASVVLIRWRLGVPVWTGDRRHFSHRLVRRGMAVRQAVGVIYLATLVTALPALLLPKAGWLLAAGVVVQTLLVVCLVALLESSGSSAEEI